MQQKEKSTANSTNRNYHSQDSKKTIKQLKKVSTAFTLLEKSGLLYSMLI